VPHGYRITSNKADLLMLSTQPSPEQMAEAAAKYGNIILGPPR
jgi:hypothetical protein